MYAKRTVFDLVLPRIMADDEIFPEEVAAYGEGGLCLSCKVCYLPQLWIWKVSRAWGVQIAEGLFQHVWKLQSI